MIFVEGKLRFKPYFHKQTLSQGTIVKTKDNELLVIDDNDWDNSNSIEELNYYCFKIEEHIGIDLFDGYDDPYDNPRFRMINQNEVLEYSTKKIKLW